MTEFLAIAERRWKQKRRRMMIEPTPFTNYGRGVARVTGSLIRVQPTRWDEYHNIQEAKRLHKWLGDAIQWLEEKEKG